MPEDYRDCAFDPDEDFPWDCDVQWALDDELGGDEEDDE